MTFLCLHPFTFLSITTYSAISSLALSIAPWHLRVRLRSRANFAENGCLPRSRILIVDIFRTAHPPSLGESVKHGVDKEKALCRSCGIERLRRDISS
jgi:hypothetical protein